jgi:hypothetical protein
LVHIRVVSVPLVLGLALALGGCGLLPQVQLPQGNATPTPTAVSAEQAATVYSATICTFNDGASAFADTWQNDAASLRDLKEAASLARIEAETALAGLQGTAWPADVAAEVESINGYLQARVERLNQVIAAEALGDLDDIELTTTPDEVNDAAARLEESLGLGTGFCPADEPQAPAEPADDLATTTWAGTDSDGDETEVYFGSANGAQVSVGGTLYEGTWQVADGLLTIEVASADNSLAFNGFYEAGAASIALSGTATNGHTWTVELQRL